MTIIKKICNRLYNIKKNHHNIILFVLKEMKRNMERIRTLIIIIKCLINKTQKVKKMAIDTKKRNTRTVLNNQHIR